MVTGYIQHCVHSWTAWAAAKPYPVAAAARVVLLDNGIDRRERMRACNHASKRRDSRTHAGCARLRRDRRSILCLR